MKMTLKEFADRYAEVLKEIEWKEDLATEIGNGAEIINDIRAKPEKWDKELSEDKSEKALKLFDALLKA